MTTHPTSSSTAEQLLAAGELSATLMALQQQVRKQPGDVRLRTFLFQLLAVLEQWERAASQLKLCGELDAGTLAMVSTYREALQCEAVRQAVMTGRTTPMVFGEPASWIGLLTEALAVEAKGEVAAAAALRRQALEEAPATAGTLNGTPFEWIADADSRLGPVLEVVLRGRYGWLPLSQVSRVVVEPPADLRDLVWMPAHLFLPNGGESVALIPTRYTGPDLGAYVDTVHNDALLLARRTDWHALAPEQAPEQYRGSGQRVLTSSGPELGLLDVRELVLHLPPAEAA
jgi:type VI secretion system protein ImpE